MGMIYIPTLVMGMTNQRPMSKKNRNDDAGDPSWTMMDDWWDDVSSIISIQGFQRRFFYALVIYIYTHIYIYICVYISVDIPIEILIWLMIFKKQLSCGWENSQ